MAAAGESGAAEDATDAVERALGDDAWLLGDGILWLLLLLLLLLVGEVLAVIGRCI